jgi:hypothetical protein
MLAARLKVGEKINPVIIKAIRLALLKTLLAVI